MSVKYLTVQCAWRKAKPVFSQPTSEIAKLHRHAVLRQALSLFAAISGLQMKMALQELNITETMFFIASGGGH